MNDNDNVRVTKLENWLDTAKLVLEATGAVVGICVGIGTICKVSRTLSAKKNDPIGYWNNKLGSNETSRAVNRLTDAVERLVMKI